MKKAKRILAGLMLASFILSLCSCKKLDEMKRLHAVWNNEDRTEILWNGAVYQRLPAFESEHLYAENVLVTDADVPVLLSEIYGQSAHKDPSENLIYFDYYIFDEAYSMGCFARSDLYERYEAAAKNPKLDRICAEISIYTHNDGEITTAAAVLSEALTERIKQAVKNGALEALSEDEAETFYADYVNIYGDPDYDIQGSAYLYLSDEVMLCLESIGSISTYMSAESGEYAHFLTCSEPMKVFGPDEDENSDSCIYLFKDSQFYRDIMDELTGE